MTSYPTKILIKHLLEQKKIPWLISTYSNSNVQEQHSKQTLKNPPPPQGKKNQHFFGEKNHSPICRNFYMHSNTLAAGVTTGVPVLLEENSNGGSLFNRMYYEKEEELGEKTTIPTKVFFF